MTSKWPDTAPTLTKNEIQKKVKTDTK